MYLDTTARKASPSLGIYIYYALNKRNNKYYPREDSVRWTWMSIPKPFPPPVSHRIGWDVCK